MLFTPPCKGADGTRGPQASKALEDTQKTVEKLRASQLHASLVQPRIDRRFPKLIDASSSRQILLPALRMGTVQSTAFASVNLIATGTCSPQTILAPNRREPCTKRDETGYIPAGSASLDDLATASAQGLGMGTWPFLLHHSG